VQERINAVARQEKWGLELTWAGFRSSSSGEVVREMPEEVEPGMRTSLKGLLRRFASNEWVDERLSGWSAREQNRP
jgi:hypothetical protein